MVDNLFIHLGGMKMQDPYQVCNTLTRAKVRCVSCVMLFPKFHHNDTTDLLPTC